MVDDNMFCTERNRSFPRVCGRDDVQHISQPLSEWVVRRMGGVDMGEELGQWQTLGTWGSLPTGRKVVQY